jgi:hypothetical protein
MEKRRMQLVYDSATQKKPGVVLSENQANQVLQNSLGIHPDFPQVASSTSLVTLPKM